MIVILAAVMSTWNSPDVLGQAAMLGSGTDANDAHGQPDHVVRRCVDLYAVGGYAIRLAGDGQRVNSVTYAFGGAAGAFRCMWQPEFRLAVGLEAGYFPVTTIEADTVSTGNDARLALSAVPIFAMTSMRFGGLQVLGGIGVYSYAVDGTSIQRRGIAASALEIGYTLGVGYERALFDRAAIGGELRLYQFTDRPITVIMPGIRVRFSVIEY